MRGLIVAAALMFGMQAHAQVLPGPDRAAIHDVIQGQLDAFRRDDGAAAFAFAAPNIRSMFGTADVFMDMVRRGYAPVYRPRSTEFTDLLVEDGQFVQHVELVGPDGRNQTALYTMVRGEDGSWRIASCVLVDSARVGV